MYHYTVIEWGLFFFLYSFIGWIWETTFVSIKKRKIVNRGFMTGPFLPIYGFGVLAILLATLPVKNNYILVFLFGMLAATVLEYVTGAVMEAMFKVRYWDYSKVKFNLNGHICLGSSIGWGVSSILIVRFIHTPISNYLLKIPNQIGEIIVLILAIGVSFDCACSVRDALDLREVLEHMKECNEEIRKLQKRLDVVIAVVDDEKQNIYRKLEKMVENKSKDKPNFIGKKLELVKKRMESFESLLSSVEVKMKKPQKDELRMELEGIKERIAVSLARLDIGKQKLKKHTTTLLKRNPLAVSKMYREELEEIRKSQKRNHRKK